MYYIKLPFEDNYKLYLFIGKFNGHEHNYLHKIRNISFINKS